MEDLIILPPNDSSALSEVPESVLPALPEALQPPTKPVSAGFSILLSAANAVLYICWIGVGALLLPLQVEHMDKANKIGILGIGLGLTALLPLVITPIAGALSDRTASRFGRRRPWIFVGAILSALALTSMMLAGNIVILFIGWGFFQIGSNLILATLTAILPDQVPETQRGAVSGIVGLGYPVGIIVGGVVPALLDPSISYIVIIAILLFVLIPYSLFLHDKILPREYIASFDLWVFLKKFWINPRKHPDFGWAWLTRFLTLLAYIMSISNLLYYLQYYLNSQHLFSDQQMLQKASTVQIITTLVMIVSIVIGGLLSDRFQRRKIFVVIAGVIMALALFIYGFLPLWTMILVAAGLLGFGLGMYISVDLALVTQVLPSADDRGKDLGIISIANTLPQSLAPLVAAFIITQFHSYPILFSATALVILLGGILIQPIKSVR
jgi:MFS family permease